MDTNLNLSIYREAAKNLNDVEVYPHLFGKPFNYMRLKYTILASNPELIICGEYIIHNKLLACTLKSFLDKLRNKEDSWLLETKEQYENFIQNLEEKENKNESEIKIETLKTKIKELRLPINQQSRLTELMTKIAATSDKGTILCILDTIFNEKIYDNFTRLLPLINIFHPKINNNFYNKKFRKNKGFLK